MKSKKMKNIIEIRNVGDYIDKIEENKTLLERSVIVYCRVSTKKQTETHSLSDQSKMGIDFYKKQKFDKIEYDNIIIIREEGKSGDDVDEDNSKIVRRILLQFILNEVRNKRVKYFWCYDTNRVCRSTEIGNNIWKLFRDYKVNFYVGNTKRDVNSQMDKFYWMFMNLVDEIENEKRFYRGLIGKLSSIKRNNHWGGPHQYGYKKGNKNGKIVLDKSKSKIVKKIFDLYSKGKSINDIIIYLNSNEILSPNNKEIWNEGSIRKMLKNKTYIGIKEIGVKLIKNISREKCIELGQFEIVNQKTIKIVEEDIFNSVQKLLEVNKRLVKISNVRKHTFLLNDILYCGNCGNTMKSKYNPKQNRKIYFCNWSELDWKNQNNGKFKKCGKGISKSINIDVSDTLVWNEILHHYSNSYNIREQFKNKYLPIKLKERDQPLKQIKSYNKDISDIKRTIKKLKSQKIDLYGKKLILEIDDTTFQRFENDINSKIEKENNKILSIKGNIGDIRDNIKWYDWFKDFENKFSEIKKYKSLDDKRKFIDDFVEKIEVFWDNITNTHKIKIYFKFYIVKDDRIRKEKYVFKVLKGKNYSEINEINSRKMKELMNKEKKLTTSKLNYSTVTDLAKFLG